MSVHLTDLMQWHPSMMLEPEKCCVNLLSRVSVATNDVQRVQAVVYLQQVDDEQ